MNLSKKVGQLLIVGIPNYELTSDVIQHLKKWHVGGIILFSRNLKDVEQTAQLISQLNALLSSEDWPLWLCVDQEGGLVVRLTKGVSVFPGNMALGATQNRDYAYQQGRQTALEWGKLGFNVNFAPVLDLSYAQNPGVGIRSLGSDPKKVADLGLALIRGMQDHAMWSTAKHFPGKGLAKQDAHLDLPFIHETKERLWEIELYPFRQAIDSAFMMTSHCVYPALDEKQPATISKSILTDLLRRQMEYKGLIVSDDLEMGAISKVFPVCDAAVRFLQAGGDQVLVCHGIGAIESTFNTLYQAVEKGTIDDLDQKLDRIQLWKTKWKEKKEATQEKVPQNNLVYEIAKHSITLVKNKNGLIPLKLKPNQKLSVICVDYAPLTLVEDFKETFSLEQLIKSFHSNVDFIQVPVEPSHEQIIQLTQPAEPADFYVIFTYNAHFYPSQVELVNAFGRKTLIVCALRNPYDIYSFPNIEHYMVSYGFRAASLKALIETLFGKIKPQGQLPVNLS